jgi:hypothetical protein
MPLRRYFMPRLETLLNKVKNVTHKHHGAVWERAKVLYEVYLIVSRENDHLGSMAIAADIQEKLSKIDCHISKEYVWMCFTTIKALHRNSCLNYIGKGPFSTVALICSAKVPDKKKIMALAKFGGKYRMKTKDIRAFLHGPKHTPPVRGFISCEGLDVSNLKKFCVDMANAYEVPIMEMKLTPKDDDGKAMSAPKVIIGEGAAKKRDDPLDLLKTLKR